MSIPNATLEVCASHLADDGRGVARDGELEIYVADLLPGEAAEIEIEHRSAHHPKAWATIVRRIGQPSSARSDAACAAFGSCGGCTWQHLDYSGQLAQKRRRLQEAFNAYFKDPPEVPLPQGAPSVLHYRNKGKYVFARKGDAIVLGAYRARSHEVVSTLGCRIVEACIDEVAAVLQMEAQAQQLAIFDERQARALGPPKAGMRYAVLRSNAAGSVLLILVCTSQTGQQEVETLALAMQEHPRVVGVLRCDNDLESGTLLTDSIRPVCGSATLEERLFDKPFALGPLSFWQVHRSQAELAYRAIATAIPQTEGGIVLELYAGTGGIAFALADAGHQVLGVDINEEAVAAANQATAERGLGERLRFACADATRLGAEYFMQVCAVVVDPPRKGLGQRGVQQLAQSLPPRIVYLSCGPDSLARDLRELIQVGYRIESMQAFDFMPGTAQVECLVVLARS